MRVAICLLLIAASAWGYWQFVRPWLAKQPYFQPIFAKLDEIEAGWLAKVKAWFTMSWTINWGNLQIAAGTLLSVLDDIKALDLTQIIPQWAGPVVVIMGLITIALRIITVRPLGEKL